MPEPRNDKSDVPVELWDVLPEPLREFLSNGKTQIATDNDDWTVSIQKPPGYFKKVLPPGSVLLANNGCGDQLFLVPGASVSVRLDSKVHVYWHEGPHVELLAEDLGKLLNPPPAAVTKRPPVLYHNRTPVHLGDEVTARSFFIRRPGRVVYVPGISKRNRNMEHHGLGWVGITCANGLQIGTVVDPKTSCLKKSVRFVKRSAEPFREMTSDDRFE